MNLMLKLSRSQKGQSQVIFSLFLVVILAFLGVAIDAGRFAYTKIKMQNAADFSALVGAHEILYNRITAVNTVVNYGVLNGVNKYDVRVSVDNNNRTVQVWVSESVNLFCLVGSLPYKIDVSATAIAKADPGSAFKYLIFSGGTSTDLKISGASGTYDGKVHANGSASITGSNNKFNDIFECTKTLSIPDTNISFTKLINPAEAKIIIIMSKTELETKAAKKYSNSITFTDDIVLNGDIYVNGNVTIACSKIKGRGNIIATGNINFTSPKIQYDSDNDLVTFCSYGNITSNVANQVIDGVLYAPNGTISVKGNNTCIKGAIIAKTIDIQGTGCCFIYDNRAGQTLLMSNDDLFYLIK